MAKHARNASAAPLGFARLREISPRLALAGDEFDFKESETGSGNQFAFFRRRHILPGILGAKGGGGRRLVGQGLMIVVKKLGKPFGGYFLNRHDLVPFQQPAFTGIKYIGFERT